jgi:hypothetical protein
MNLKPEVALHFYFNRTFNFKLFVPCILSTYEIKNQQMSLFQFYSYIDGSLHVSGLQAHPQENSHSCPIYSFVKKHITRRHRARGTAKSHNIIVNKGRNL